MNFQECALESTSSDRGVADAGHAPGDRAARGASRDLYLRLRRLAAFLLVRERRDHTLQATALVHEALLRLGWPVKDADRGRALGLAARAMRQVLVNHALRRRARRRGGDLRRLPLDAALDLYEARCGDIAALHEALRRLAALDPRQARIVELRFFGGLELDAIAGLLDVSARTVERDWRLAREWLRSELEAR